MFNTWDGPDPEEEDVEEEDRSSLEEFGDELDDAMLGDAASSDDEEDEAED